MVIHGVNDIMKYIISLLVLQKSTNPHKEVVILLRCNMPIT